MPSTRRLGSPDQVTVIPNATKSGVASSKWQVRISGTAARLSQTTGFSRAGRVAQHKEVLGLASQQVPGRARTIGVGLLAACTVVAGVITALGVPSSASETSPSTAAVATADSPNYVAVAALPQGARFGSWTAGAIDNGLPAKSPFCLDGVFDPSTTGNRGYYGKTKVAAEELVSVLGSSQAADDLVSKLRTQIQGCYQQWLNMDIPAYRKGHRSASWARYASSDAPDEPTIYGVFTVPPPGFDHATNLYAVGRRGNTVMVMHMVLVGDRGNAPAVQFQSSAMAAMSTLY